MAACVALRAAPAIRVQLFSAGLWGSLFRTVTRGRHGHTEANDMRFLLLIGPASFITYSAIANAALNNGDLNTWTVLLASMLTLMPAFEPRTRSVRVLTPVVPSREPPQMQSVTGVTGSTDSSPRIVDGLTFSAG